MLLLSRDTGSVSLIRATSFERPWSCDLLTGADQFYPMPNILDKGTPSRLPRLPHSTHVKEGFRGPAIRTCLPCRRVRHTSAAAEGRRSQPPGDVWLIFGYEAGRGAVHGQSVVPEFVDCTRWPVCT